MRGRRSRWLVRVAVSSLGCMVAIAACGFPDVTFGPVTEREAGSSEGSAPDADAEIDAQADVYEKPPPIFLDATLVDDTGPGKVDASGCVTCDCDKDTFDRPDCGASLGPRDCDDNDTRTQPYQGHLAADAEVPRNGDWDCNGSVEKLFREDVDCNAITLASLFGKSCSTIYGFVQPIACGQQGTWYRCREPGGLSLNCEIDPTQTKPETQRCH